MSRYSFQARSIAISTVGFLASLGIGSFASADPLPGEVLKFQQLPLGDLQTNPNPIAPGHDELSTATLSTASAAYTGTFAADDFSDNVSSPIVDVQWWGSYLPNSTGVQTNQVQQFLISFESDVPSNAAQGFSEPGQVLSSQVVTIGPQISGSGNFTPKPVPSVPGPDGQLYEYNAELANPFPEVANTVYWLKIVALTNPSDDIQWGWHNRDYTIGDPLASPVPVPGENIEALNGATPVWHFQDDAVTGNVTYFQPQNFLTETTLNPLLYNNSTDGFPAGAVTPSEDLAFNLYYQSVPEPASTGLLVVSGIGMLARRRRKTA
jgi:hypothetical protein